MLFNESDQERPPLDLVGTALASAGLFSLVYGFSNSEMESWGHPLTIVALGLAVVLLVAFVLVERRVAHPLLPLRIVADRTRGGSFLAIGIAGIAMFGVFLFLTYYLQQTKGFTPIQTGLAFLPMTAAIMITATSVNIRFLGIVGPRPLMVLGMSLGALAMVWLAQLTPESGYALHVLPALIVMGVGMGNIFAPAFTSATYGVWPHDSGVASATVNTMQQVGGSVGTALLSSIFAGAAASYAQGRPPSPQLMADAAVHGYTVSFWVSAGIFVFGAVTLALLMRPVKVGQPAAEPVPA
jgi:hypothetical protein